MTVKYEVLTPTTGATNGGNRSVDIEPWLDAVSDHVFRSAPELSDLLSDYVGEARFGAGVIDTELANLPTGSSVLEIGAGMLLLSCALQAAGYRVSALEPIGSGFSHMDRLRQIVWDFATRQGSAPKLDSIKAEQLDRDREFDYAFSINVMEHVDDVALVLRRVWSALRPGASYRFVCPNYAFPYEPHFGIPTLFSKALTERVFRRRILASPIVADPRGTWTSLNWISVASVRRIARESLGVEPEFDRMVLDRYVRRAIAGQLAALRPKLVIVQGAAFLYEGYWRPFHEPPPLALLGLGASAATPPVEGYLRDAGLYPPLVALCASPNLLLVAQPVFLPAAQQFLSEHDAIEAQLRTGLHRQPDSGLPLRAKRARRSLDGELSVKLLRTRTSGDLSFPQSPLPAAIADSAFSAHSPLIRRAFTLLDTVGAFKLVPARGQPVMSCRLERPMANVRPPGRDEDVSAGRIPGSSRRNNCTAP